MTDDLGLKTSRRAVVVSDVATRARPELATIWRSESGTASENHMEAGTVVVVAWMSVTVACTGEGAGVGVAAGSNGLPTWQETRSRLLANIQKQKALLFPTRQAYFILRLIVIPPG